MWAIVGSSGFERFDEFEIVEHLPRETPFGLCSNGFYRIKVKGQEALFMCRTSQGEDILPSKINYQANIYALKKHGATAILSLSSVRSLREELKPGDLVIPYQYIDRTKGGRVSTFCDDGLLSYVSLTHPISEEAAEVMRKYRKDFDFPMHFGQAYVCIDGPQFPTMLDAKCYQSMGGGIMGMTGFPEFALAREAGLHYLPCNFVVDYVPWSPDVVNIDCVLEIRHSNYDKALHTIEWVIDHLGDYADNDCQHLSFASFIGSDISRLTPRQRSWFDVLARSNSVAKAKTEIKPSTIQLYHGNKPIPTALQELINFTNRYSKDTVQNIESVRKAAGSLKLYAGQTPQVASVKDFAIKAEGHEIPVRLYHPDPSQPLPIMLYVHGGGYVSGTLDSFDVPCRHLSLRTQHVVISIDYRLAPEHRYPAGLEDVCSVAQWVYANAKALKASAKDIVICGDSAGANLATLATYRSLKQDWQIAQQILMYPSLDLTHSTESMEQFGQGYMLTAEKSRWYTSQYLPDGVEAKDPSVSPLFMDDLSQMPRTFIITAGYDPLRDEGLLYAEKLMQQSVATHHYHFDNLIHGFINFGKLIPDEMEMLYQRIHNFLAQAR